MQHLKAAAVRLERERDAAVRSPAAGRGSVEVPGFVEDERCFGV